MHVALAVTLAVWALAVTLMFWLKEPGERPVGLVFGRLMTTNPVRMVTNLFAIQTARDPGRKAKAVRDLGHSRTKLAIEEVSGQIEDPDVLVRETAVQALGEMGAPEAVPMLKDLLDDAECDVRASAAKALGGIKCPEAVTALVAHVEDGDPEVQREVALALGRQGSADAVPALLALLRTRPPLRLYAAAAQALSQAGEWAAVEDILEVYLTTRNRRFRNRLAVAISDVAGRPGEFYPVLCREIRDMSSGVRLLKYELRKQMSQRVRRISGGRMRRRPDETRATRARWNGLLEALVLAYEEEDFDASLDAAEALLVTLPGVLAETRGAEEAPAEPARSRIEAILAAAQRLLVRENRPEATEVMLALYLTVQVFRSLRPESNSNRT
jgi:hypothetical protein